MDISMKTEKGMSLRKTRLGIDTFKRNKVEFKGEKKKSWPTEHSEGK